MNKTELAQLIVRLQEERDMRIKEIRNYMSLIEKWYNKEIQNAEKRYNELCKKNY